MVGSRDAEFDNLIHLTIKIGNGLIGMPNPFERKNLIYAEGLGQKIICHTLSSRQLYSGLNFLTNDGLKSGMIDFASICILTRGALETYLTFNYIFIDSTNDAECDFRFLCWDLGGYLDRSGFSTETKEHIELQKQELDAIERVRKELQLNSVYQSLSKRLQKRALEGQWRLDLSWADLAVKAGFSEKFFRQQYKFLCGYAHSNRLSVIQIQQIKTILGQKEMAEASMGVLMTILAKYIFDYVNLIPALKSTINFMTFENAPVLIWKGIGESL